MFNYISNSFMVDVDMLNSAKSMLADVSSISPSSEQRYNIVRHLSAQWDLLMDSL